MTTTEISNTDNVIDSRDVIARIEELEGWRDDARTTAEEALAAIKADEDELHAKGTPTEDELDAIEERKDNWPTFTDSKGNEHYDSSDWDEEAAEELIILLALQDDAEGCSDWRHGETLISENYFEQYAQQLAEDIGAVGRNAKWPYDCIDWEKAAGQLQQDYISGDFGGEMYWIRS
jgi:hypothetical protein